MTVPPPPPPPGSPPPGGPPPAGSPGHHPAPGDPPWPPDEPDGARPARAFRVPFSAAEGFLLVLWTLLAQLLVVLPAALLGLVGTDGGPTLLLLVVVSQAVGLAGALAWLAVRGRLSWRVLGPRRPRGVHLAIGLAVGVVGFLAVNLGIAALLQLVGPVDPPEQQLLTDVTAGGVSTFLAVVAAVVMAPLVEEVVFRGIFFQALKRRLGLWPGVVISGLLFATVHFEVQQPIYSAGLFVLGAGFAWSLHRFGSLLVPIAAHATFNGISVSLAILGERLLDTV